MGQSAPMVAQSPVGTNSGLKQEGRGGCGGSLRSIPQMITECLLCARCWANSWGQSGERNQQGHQAYILTQTFSTG